MSNDGVIINVKDVHHVLREGIIVLGSKKNDRYTTVLVDDESICSKHASIRYDPISTNVEVMDLCSVHGVTVDQRPIEALTWYNISNLSQITVGTVPVSVEKTVSRNGRKKELEKEDLSFLNDEDSNDFIDCSLEVTKPERKAVKSGNESPTATTVAEDVNTLPLRNALAKDDADATSTSFLVPATQQLDESAISTAAEDCLASVKPCVVEMIPIDGGPAPGKRTATPTVNEQELEDDDDFFIIPETQQPTDDNQCSSPIVGRIASQPEAIGCERAGRAQAEDEYFQMTVEDDDNSNDGVFNNVYVEASQNLLKHMDESYMKVDSISGQEGGNTTQDMSRLEWNETRQEHEQSLVEKVVPSAQPDADNRRSITPDLQFDEPGKDGQHREREGTVTPEVDFDKVLDEGVSGAAQTTSKLPPSPVVTGEDVDEHEISLNQEGCAETPVEKTSNDIGTKTVDQLDDIETQALDFDCETASVEREAEKNEPTTGTTEAVVCAYDMETQALSFNNDGIDEDPYDLLTQPFAVRQRSSSVALDQQTAPATVHPDDLLTQPMIPPSTLRKSFMNEKTIDPQPSTSSRAAPMLPIDMETQPMSPRGVVSRGSRSSSIDPEDLLTQPMSPPKYLQEDRFNAWKKPSAKSFDAYDQPTQPLVRSFGSYLTMKKDTKLEDILGPKRPLVKVVDIQRTRSSQEFTDPYAMQTQPMSSAEKKKRNAYDLQTQPLEPQESPGQKTVRVTSHEISQFDPQINSTVRQSLLQQSDDQINRTKQRQKEVEISPSSNKENRTGQGVVVLSESGTDAENEDEDLDDEVHLSATLPMDDPQRMGKVPSKRARGRPRKVDPSSSKVTSETAEEFNTPKPPTGRNRRSVELTEFLTPEHPLLSLPKADSILMASGHMRELAAAHLRSVKGSSKYHFDDSSSSGSDGEDRLVFKKTNVSVAFERETEKLKAASKQMKPVPEKLSTNRKRVGEKVEPVSKDASDVISDNSPKRIRKASDEKRSSSSIKDDRKDKVSKRSTEKYRTEHEHGSGRVSTRSGRQIRPKRPNDDSVECQSKPVTTATTSRPTHLRQPKERRASEREEKKARSDELVTVAPIVQKRESKRQKAANYARHRSPSPVEATKSRKAYTTERTRKTTTSTLAKKVDVAPSSTTLGILTGDSLHSAGLKGGHADVSATSSTGSDGTTRSVRSNRPRLIFTRMNPEPYRKSIGRAGGKIVDIPELANVLVTDRVFRTYKFLCAVAKGIPIVGQSYLDALQAANEHDPVDPWEHILYDEVTETRYKFRLRDTLLKARKHKLFQDYTVFVTSGTQPPPSELFLILSCAGATPLKHPGQSANHSGKMFVISDPADAASWPKYKEKYPTIEIVSTEGFMLSIILHLINFKKHRLL